MISKINSKNLIQKNKQLEENLKRIVADFENYRKRQEKILEQIVINGNKELIIELVPIMDNFQRAFSQIPKNINDSSWLNGIKQIEKQFESILNKFGVKKISTIGMEFNPQLHEAVMSKKDANINEGFILQETENGYILNNKVIKPAKVIVSSGK